jgi:hypothetical protein
MASLPEDAPVGTFPPDAETEAETTVLSPNPKTQPASFAALSDLEESDDESDDDAVLPSLQAAASERAPGAIGMFLYSLFSKRKGAGGNLSAKDTTSAYLVYLKVLFRTQPVSAVFMAVTLGALAVAYATLPVFVNLAFRIVYLSPGVRGVSLDQFARWVGLYSLCIFVCAVVFERTFLYARAGLMREVSLLALQFSEMDESVSDAQLHGFLTSDADEFRRFAHHAHQVVLMSAAAGACFLASLVEVPQLASVLIRSRTSSSTSRAGWSARRVRLARARRHDEERNPWSNRTWKRPEWAPRAGTYWAFPKSQHCLPIVQSNYSYTLRKTDTFLLQSQTRTRAVVDA